MGLFDGFEAGWNSFKNNELKTISNVALAPNPVVKLISNPQKAIEDPLSLLPSAILGNGGPIQAAGDAGQMEKTTGGGDGYIPASEWETVVNDAGNTFLAPNPIISAVTGNWDDIPQTNKPAGEKWQNVADKTVKPFTDTVKETVNNVTKGVGSALPIIAIGGAAVLVLGLLFGRR